ncbi:hypothetical protein [Terriglobus sp. ADX1]|uniref:hypothetical protein n=1 Tax=Terriglobus sp. ADX1 TaxID=2794063 RepID=UPI002FE5D2F7
MIEPDKTVVARCFRSQKRLTGEIGLIHAASSRHSHAIQEETSRGKNICAEIGSENVQNERSSQRKTCSRDSDDQGNIGDLSRSTKTLAASVPPTIMEVFTRWAVGVSGQALIEDHCSRA